MSQQQSGASSCREAPQPSLEEFYQAAGGSYEEVLGRLNLIKIFPKKKNKPLAEPMFLFALVLTK